MSIKHLTPFKRCVIQNFPFIEADFDALTNYGLLCKIVEYLNGVIASQNTVIDNVNQLSEDFTNLKNFVDNFFDNLDVQEEINNKLDAMAEDGSLGRILSAYSFAVSPYAFGAVGDGVTDDTEALQDCMDYANEHKLAVYFPSNQTFYITEPINIYSNIEIQGNNAKITTDQNISMITSEGIVHDVIIEGLNLTGADDNTYTDNIGIKLVCYYSRFSNLKIFNCYSGIYLHHTGADGSLVENRFENIRVSKYRLYGLFLGASNNNKLTDGFLNNIICNSASDSTESNVIGIYIGSTAGYNINGVHIYGNNATAIHLNNAFYSNIDEFYIEKTIDYGLLCSNTQIGLNISNGYVKNNAEGTTGNAIYISPSSYLPFTTHSGNITNINISRGSQTTGKSIVVATENHYFYATNIVIDGDTRTIKNDCSGLYYNDYGIHKDNDYTLSLNNKNTLESRFAGYKKDGPHGVAFTSKTITVPQLASDTQAVVKIYAVGGKNTYQTRLSYEGIMNVCNHNGTYYATIENQTNTLFTVTAPTVSGNSNTNEITINFEVASDVYFTIWYEMLY